MILKTSDPKGIKPYLAKLHKPTPSSHKGQNGKLLVIGGSSLFHAASIWSAAVASRIVDIVHYSSTIENNEVFVNLKSKFVDGIVVKKQDIPSYVAEDDCVLVGPGMVRGPIDKKKVQKIKDFKNLLPIDDEPTYTHALIHHLTQNFPKQKYVFDGGAIQMMDKDWLKILKSQAIVTPHPVEFQKLFDVPVKGKRASEMRRTVTETAQKYHCTILLKAVHDIVSDGQQTVEIHGGNQGLTKGGTGDALAGLVAALFAKSTALPSAVASSYIVKSAAETLAQQSGLWYNTTDLVHQIPKTAYSLLV